MVNIVLPRDQWVKISEVSTSLQLKASANYPAYLYESLTEPTFTPDDSSDVLVIAPIDIFEFTFVDKHLWAYTSSINLNIVKDV